MTAANTGRTAYFRSDLRRPSDGKPGYRSGSKRIRRRRARKDRIISFIAGALFATAVLVLMFLLSAGTAKAEPDSPL